MKPNPIQFRGHVPIPAATPFLCPLDQVMLSVVFLAPESWRETIRLPREAGESGCRGVIELSSYKTKLELNSIKKLKT